MLARGIPARDVRQALVRGLAMALLVATAPVVASLATESRTEPAKPPAAAESTAVPDKLSIPESDRNRKNPVPNVPEARESGKRTFNGNCARCHGPLGDGTGETSRKMHWTIPNLSSAEFQARWTDGELFYILSHGHGAMPSHKISDEQKWEVILHVRTLVRTPAAPPKP